MNRALGLGVLLLVACGVPVASVSPASERTSERTSAADASVPMEDVHVSTDGSVEASVRADAVVVDEAPRSNPCAEHMVIDLNAVGTTQTNTTQYTGTTGSMTLPRSTINPPEHCNFTANHVVALRYTPRTTSRLRVSVVGGFFSSLDPDPVLWIQDACTQGATTLGCNDDSTGYDIPTFSSTAITDTLATVGFPLYFFVGGFGTASNSQGGAYRLTVTELSTSPQGAQCSSNTTSECEPGTVCVPDPWPSQRSTCRTLGGAGSFCRPRGAPCDAGLECDGSRCLRPATAGQACDDLTRCAANTSCVGGTCRPMGQGGSRCHFNKSSLCDEGFACYVGYCIPAIPAGGECSLYPQPPSTCVNGTSCQWEIPGMRARCVADGADGGQCRTTSTGPRCNEGLSCYGNRCRPSVPLVPVGGTCSTSYESTQLCGADTTCAPGSTTSTMVCTPHGQARSACRNTGIPCDEGLACMDGRCLPIPTNAGEEGRSCRASGLSCNAGLVCRGEPSSSSSTCVRSILLGGTCNARGVYGICTAGTSCSRSQDGVCTADGTRNAHCRTTDPPCDAGLACSRAVAASTADPARCLPVLSLGEVCDTTRNANLCAAGLRCERPVGMSTGKGTCRRPPYRIEPSDARFINACAAGQRIPFVFPETLMDDAYNTQALTLAHPFQLFDTAVSQFFVHTNGLVVFSNRMPTSIPNGPAIYAYGADLVLRPTRDSGVCVLTVGNAPNRRTIIEWENVYRYGQPDSVLTFEVFLNEGSNVIELVYPRINGLSPMTAPPTVSIRDEGARMREDFDQQISTDTALRFLPQ